MRYKWCAAGYAVLVLFGGFYSYAEELKSGQAPLPQTVLESKEKAAATMAEDQGNQTGQAKNQVPTDKKLASTAAATEALRAISNVPLQETDFSIRGISLGQNAGTVTVLSGTPDKVLTGSVRNEYQWKDLTVRMVNELAYQYGSRSDLTLSGEKITGPGVEAIAVTGSSVMTSRGLTVGSSRENVLRTYGRPDRILWDGPKSVFYFVYDKGEKSLIFTIGKNKVERILITRKDPKFGETKPAGLYGSMTRMSVDDFQIAGFSLGTIFHEYNWLVWEKKAMNPEEEVWYYAGFAVRMDKKTHTIEAAFLTDSRMTTYRGITIGDHVSTLEAMYGAPEKLEMNAMDGHPQSAYIYFSPNKQNVLIFYVDTQSKKVQNVLVMPNPQVTGPFQSALDKVNHARAKNHAEKVS